MQPTVVDRLYREFRELVDILAQASETSLTVTADDCFRKILLLSAASLFETAVTDIIHAFVSETTNRNECVVEFVRRKALARQYHTLFDWDKRNAGKFFGLFGDTLKTAMEARTKSDEEFAFAVAAFLELGGERNRLVHQNLGQLSLEKTADEIFQLYQRATVFIDQLPEVLRSGGAGRAGYGVATFTASRRPQIAPAESLVSRGDRRAASFLAREARRSLHQGRPRETRGPRGSPIPGVVKQWACFRHSTYGTVADRHQKERRTPC
jgi:hypothetical protein